jgi:O-6-methylguanine DNA methyltransferase
MSEYWLLTATNTWLKLMVTGQCALAEVWRVYLGVWLEQHWQNFGSAFQQQVWQQINQINFGETKSYGHIALLIKKPRAFRAVANACGANPWPFLIPCHRVVASGFVPKSWRNLGGYGFGTGLKRALLTQELQMS